MNNTYAIIIDPEMEVHTLRIDNQDDNNQQVGMHNLMEWLSSTAFGRFEFSPDKCMWFAMIDDDLNPVATGLMGNRVVIRGNVVITTWSKRGVDCEGIPETDLPDTWVMIEEVITYNKMYMDTHDLSLEQLRKHIEEKI